MKAIIFALLLVIVGCGKHDGNFGQSPRKPGYTGHKDFACTETCREISEPIF